MSVNQDLLNDKVGRYETDEFCLFFAFSVIVPDAGSTNSTVFDGKIKTDFIDGYRSNICDRPEVLLF